MSVHILLIKQTSLGDVLHSTAQVRAIRKTLPNCRITLLTSTTAYDIYRHNPRVDKIILFDRYRIKRDWWRHPISVFRHVLDTMREVRRESFDLALDLQGRWKSVIFLWGAQSPRRFVKGRWWFAQRFYRPKLHALQEMNGVVQLAGLGNGGLKMEFFTSSEERASLNKIFDRHNLGDRRWILCCPISRWPTKDWPLCNFVLLSHRLPDDITLVFTGDPAHRKMIYGGLGGIDRDRVINLAGMLTLLEFAELTARAPVVITGDSFPMHVASANDRPMVALFGPTDEARVGPVNGEAAIVLRAEHTNCSRCYRRTRCSKACINHISPEQVYHAVRRVTTGFI